MESESPDWGSIVTGLRVAGLTQRALATRLGISTNSVSALACGHVREIPYARGSALISLWQAAFPGRPVPTMGERAQACEVSP